MSCRRWTFAEKSFHIYSMRMPIFYPTTELVVDNLYTKYELSILYKCGDILDENVYRERTRNNTGKKKQEKRPILSPSIQPAIVNWYTKCDPSTLNSSWEIFNKKFLYWMHEEWGKEHIQRRNISRRLVLCPTKQLVIVNLYVKYELSIICCCGDIVEEKCGEKEKWTTTGKSKRRRPVLYPTIQ